MGQLMTEDVIESGGGTHQHTVTALKKCLDAIFSCKLLLMLLSLICLLHSRSRQLKEIIYKNKTSKNTVGL